MSIEVVRVAPEKISRMRELHRVSMGCQIVHDSLPARGLSHSYMIRAAGEDVGYGTLVGFGDDPKDTIDEFFVLSERRGSARGLFAALIEVGGAKRIQAQSNDPLLTTMLFDFAGDLERERILFEDGFTSNLSAPGLTFRRLEKPKTGRTASGKRVREAGEWVLERGDDIVATGGVLFHYNPPYGDLYMEVVESHRRRGYGSFLVQELKRACYEMEGVPAARCNADNAASRATLERAGMLPCGSIVTGVIGA